MSERFRMRDQILLFLITKGFPEMSCFLFCTNYNIKPSCLKYFPHIGGKIRPFRNTFKAKFRN